MHVAVWRLVAAQLIGVTGLFRSGHPSAVQLPSASVMLRWWQQHRHVRALDVIGSCSLTHSSSAGEPSCILYKRRVCALIVLLDGAWQVHSWWLSLQSSLLP
jgi:hypothetical protein